MLARSLAPALLCATLSCASAPAAPSAAPKPPTAASTVATRYFINDRADGATLLELAANKTYRVVDREHMGLWLRDTGTWTSAAPDAISLCSEHQFRAITRGDLSVYILDANHFGELPELRRRIGAWLAEHPEPELDPKAVERIMVSKGDVGAISFLPRHPTLPRADLVALAEDIAKYETATDVNLFEYRFAKVDKITFLTDDPTSAELVRNALDNGWPIQFVYLPIEETAFRDASSHPQPFVFLPAMNECVKCAGAPQIMDNSGPRVTPRCKH